MRNRISTTAVIAALALASSGVVAAAQERPRMAGRTVTTTGEAVTNRAPDQAWVTVGVEARAPKPQQAQQQAAGVMKAIQTALQGLGIPEAHIQTVAFNLNADWDYSNDQRRLRGYVVSNQVQVRVDDITKVADVLDKSIAAGGNSIHGVRWDIKDRDEAERKALAEAVVDARARAQAAAAAAGATLGQVVAITEQRHSAPQPMMRLQMARAEADMASTPISPGEIEIRSTVTVSFRIQ